MLLWAYLSCIAMFYGLAFAAQLEAFRAGVGEPRSALKVLASDPAVGPHRPRRGRAAGAGRAGGGAGHGVGGGAHTISDAGRALSFSFDAVPFIPPSSS